LSQVVRRAAAILRSLTNHPQGRSVAEVATEVDLPRSSVHRILKALEGEHLVAAVSEERGFRLGPAMMHLASSTNSWLIDTVHPYLEQLSLELDETVDLSVQSGATVYFIDQVAAQQRLRGVSEVGAAFPAHCTANGKALLARLDDTAVITLVESSLQALPPNTVIEHDALLAEMASIRETGLAFDHEEHHVGISAVGTALENPHGLAVAISVPVPTSRFAERKAEIVRALNASKAELEERFLQSGTR